MNEERNNVLRAEILNTSSIIIFTNEKELDIHSLIITDNYNKRVSIKNIEKKGEHFLLNTSTLEFHHNYQLTYNGYTSYIYLSRELLNSEELFYNGNDLGATLLETGDVIFKLWSPPATKVMVHLFSKENPEEYINSFPLKSDKGGIWQCKVSARDLKEEKNLDRCFYQYEVTAYGETKRALDPYAKSMASFQGDYYGLEEDSIGKGAIVSINSDSAAGKASKMLNSSIMSNKIDMVVYEVSIRDFTIGLEEDSENTNGTFRGFSKKIDHLKELGITHVQFLPIHNFYRVNELDRTYQDENKEIPNYNWGYDPHNFFSLEGWYSTDARGPYLRISEFKNLVRELHENSIGVIVDVVFNHTMNLEIFENVAPGCYHRTTGGAVPVGDPAIESRNLMVRKLIIDSLLNLKENYGVNGFRFDLMGFIDNQTLKEIRETLGDDIILHGEGWNFTDLPIEEAPVKGNYYTYPHNINLGMFNDTTRDAYAGWMADKGFVQGNRFLNSRVKAGIIGGIREFTNGGEHINITEDSYSLFADSPEETIQYITCHDGFTLWDKINLSLGGSIEKRTDCVKQALAMLFTSQGKVFIQGGDEICRTKPFKGNDPEPSRAQTSAVASDHSDLPDIKTFHENSYRSSDFINKFRWDRVESQYKDIKGAVNGVLTYCKGLIKLRRAIPALRYSTSENIRKGLRFIGEKTGGDRPAYSDFSQLESLTIVFINGPIGQTAYLAGEIHRGDHNPGKNPYKITFDKRGEGAITFEKEDIKKFDILKWGEHKTLNIKLVTRPGEWDTPTGAYSTTGNNGIKISSIGKENIVTIDLSLEDYTTSSPIEDEELPFVAYELDNRLEPDMVVGEKTRYEKIVVVHNVDDSPQEIPCHLIDRESDWDILMDKNRAGLTPIAAEETEVKIVSANKEESKPGYIIAPPNSSLIIAR